MIGLTLSEVERELTEMSESCNDDWDYGTAEKLRALARRIAVQIETDKLTRAA